MKSFSHYTGQQERISEFLNFCMEHLDLSDLPEIYLIDNKQAAMEAKSFGGYMPGNRVIRVNIAERHMADVFRTLAHELVHYRQDCDGRLDEMSGETGSEIENEANSLAGVIMRNFARANDRLFEEAKRDACYHKVKSRFKIWPSAYGSGALVQCRKVGAENWGNKSEETTVNEDLKKWFRQDWVRFGPNGKILGPCGDRKEHEGKPKCLPRSQAHGLGSKGRSVAASRKRRHDADPDRKGRAINVPTK